MLTPPAEKVCPGIARKYELLRRCCLGIGIVASVFTFTVGTVWGLSVIQSHAFSPVADQTVSELMAKVRDGSLPPETAETIRRLDSLIRQAYFTSVEFQRRALILLVLGLLAAAGTFHTAFRCQVRIRDPRETLADSDTKTTDRSFAVIWCVLIFALVSGIVLNLRRSSSNASRTAAAVSAPAAETKVGVKPVAVHWGSFRNGSGVAGESIAEKPQLLWKTPLETASSSSPVIAGDRIFISESTGSEQRVRAFALETGHPLWMGVVPDGGSGSELPQTSEETGLAAASPACDGLNVYAVFGTGDVVAFSHDGKKLWQKFLGRPDNTYGHSSSPIATNGVVVVQWLQSENARVLAVKAETGETVWEVKLEEAGPSWASPIILGGAVVVSGHGKAFGLNLADGKTLWTNKGVSGEVACSPAFENNHLVLMNEYSRLAVYDLSTPTEAKLLWENSDNAWPDVSSPAVKDGLIYITTGGGEVCCRELLKDEQLWCKEFKEGFYASPLIAGDLVYITDRKGILRVFKTGRAFVGVAEIPLGEPADSTPAVAEGRLIIRGQKHLMCLK